MAFGDAFNSRDRGIVVLFVVEAFRRYNTSGNPAQRLRHHRPTRRATHRGCPVKYLSLLLILIATPALAEQRHVGQVPLGNLELNWVRPEVQQLPEPVVQPQAQSVLQPQVPVCQNCVPVVPLAVQPMQMQAVQIPQVSVYRYAPWRTHRMNRELSRSIFIFPTR